jgi:hypothetical protein
MHLDYISNAFRLPFSNVFLLHLFWNMHAYNHFSNNMYIFMTFQMDYYRMHFLMHDWIHLYGMNIIHYACLNWSFLVIVSNAVSGAIL